MADRFSQGVRIAQNFRGGDVGSSVAKTIIGSRIQMNKEVEMHLLKNGIGVKKDPESGDVVFPEWADTPQKQAIMLDAYAKGMVEADKKVAEKIKVEQIVREKYWDNRFKELDDYKDNPEAGKELINTRNEEFIQTYGLEIAKIVGVDKIYDSWLAGENANTNRIKKNVEVFWTTKSIYRKSRTEDDLQKVRKAYYSIPEKERKGLETPEALTTRFPSEESQALKRRIEKAKADIKTTEKQKSLTIDQLNKRVLDLEKAKLKAQTTKGLDAIDMMLMKGNPKAQEAFKSGDSSTLIKEIDRQLQYYRGLMGGNKPKTTKQPKRKRYGILDARKAIEREGGTITPDSIKAALKQLNATLE
jgi:hypothetical protein